MAQPYQLGELGQFLTVDVTGNNIFFTANSFSFGNASVNVTINSTSFSGSFNGNTLSNTFTIGTAAYHVSNGNFGISNSGPVDKISVNGSSYLGGNVRFTQGIIDSTGSQGTAGWVLASNGSGNVYWSSSAGTNVAAQYAWTNTQSFANAVTFNSSANLVISAGARIIDSTASQGTFGQVLTSNGTGNVYWSNVTGVNVASQYTFTNTITHNANLSVNGAIFLGASNGQVGQVLTSNGTSNAYWSNVTGGGSFTNGASIAVSNIAYTNTTGTSVGVAYQFINTISGSLDTVFS